MKYIAHRGFISQAPENSIPAFRLAAQSEFHFGMECDIQQTKDNQFVVFNDDDLRRLTKNKSKTEDLNHITNKPSKIADLTYEELKLFKIKSGKNIKKYKDLYVPLLSEYLDICSMGNKTAVVEIRYLNDITQNIGLVNMVENYPSLSVIIISFNMSYLKFIRTISNIQLQLLTSIINDDIIYDCRVNSLDLSIDKRIATKENIKRLKKEGFKIAVWIVDDAKQAEAFKKMGVDYIASDKL
ncbi:MAG: glycerophosphodiester phosphodiesterase family protein [Bacillota bacterium]